MYTIIFDNSPNQGHGVFSNSDAALAELERIYGSRIPAFTLFSIRFPSTKGGYLEID